jgi:hypothetical protein
MTRPFDGTKFTHSMNLFYRYIWVLTFFCRYTRVFSCRTLRWWVRWVSIRVLGPLVPNMMLRPRHRTTFPVRPHEWPRRRHHRTQDRSALVVKFGRETHTIRLSFEKCFISIDVFFSDYSLYDFCLYIYFYFFSVMISNLVFLVYVFTLTSYKIFI